MAFERRNLYDLRMTFRLVTYFPPLLRLQNDATIAMKSLTKDMTSSRLFFITLFGIPANPEVFKNLSFPKNYLSFLEAYLVKLSQKPRFWDFLDLSFLENGRKLSFFRPEFFWRVLKKQEKNDAF